MKKNAHIFCIGFSEYQSRCGENGDFQAGNSGNDIKYSVFGAGGCVTSSHVCPFNTTSCSGKQKFFTSSREKKNRDLFFCTFYF